MLDMGYLHPPKENVLSMKFSNIYSKNGREIFPRNGMTVPKDSLILSMSREWVELKDDMLICQDKKEWNSLTQSHIGGDFFLKTSVS